MSSERIHPEWREAWAVLHATHGTWISGALVALMVALPLVTNLVPPLLILLLVAVVVRFRSVIRRPLPVQWRSPLPWLAIYYLLHVVGMAWTEDMAFGAFDLQIKAPLLLIPLLALVTPAFTKQGRDLLLFTGVLGNGLAVLVCIVAAFIRITTGSGYEVAQEVFSARFSFLVHPSYFAMYLCLSVAAWTLTPMHRWVSGRVSYAMLVLLCIGVVLCGSKLGWITLAVSIPVVLVARWKDAALRNALLGMGALSGLALALLLAGSPYARDRVREALSAARPEAEVGDAETSSAVRRITWSAAIELFQAAPLTGTGTGDVKNELLRVYASHGGNWAVEHRLNAHNQFLQSAACLGILGALSLLLALLAPLTGPSRKDLLSVVFLGLCVFNWSVESMLEVQAGVVWTALLALVLFHTTKGGPMDAKSVIL
jgi:O-antigen ligase